MVSNSELNQEINVWIRKSKERLFASYNIEKPEDEKFWVLKFFPPKYLEAFRSNGNRLWISCKPGFTWGDGIYVSPLAYPFSTMIYGRAGIMGYFDWSEDVRVYDSVDPEGIRLYQHWIEQKTQLYTMLTTTIHADRANRSLRNMFRKSFKIDLVLFRPDQYNQFYVARQRDVWFVVSDFDQAPSHAPVQPPNFSDRIKECRWVSLVTDQVEPVPSGTHFRNFVAPNLPRNINVTMRDANRAVARMRARYARNVSPNSANPHRLYLEEV